MLVALASIHTMFGFIALSRNADAAKVETIVWSIGGGFSLLLAAFLNLVRIARPADTLVRRLSVIRNFLQIFLSGLAGSFVPPQTTKNPQVTVPTVPLAP